MNYSSEPIIISLWITAIISTIIFLVQALLTFLGVDSHDGLSADFDADMINGDNTFQLFSFRNLINFLLGFSWSGIAFYGIVENEYVLVAICFLTGLAFVGIFWIIIKQLVKLSEDNSFKLEKTIGLIGDVYLTIPERRTGKGKVQISVKGTFHELDAITENQSLISGTPVKVVGIEKEKILIVEKL